MMAYNCDKFLTFQAFMLLLSTDSIYTCFMIFILFSSETFRKATQRGVLLVGVMKLDDKEPSSMADVPGLQ
ncbi:hypothetical protein PVAP13_2KG423205 [Panicum virgatum]|uniref:Uncharacterized protein n=1 Tax=Panicum virgatum TaxID=38727 RepID=A0A8T0WCZ7_PANVG|nr:hypothetical protein PVAP13_2KG423205 [Panicum virgatum]